MNPVSLPSELPSLPLRSSSPSLLSPPPPFVSRLDLFTSFLSLPSFSFHSVSISILSFALLSSLLFPLSLFPSSLSAPTYLFYLPFPLISSLLPSPISRSPLLSPFPPPFPSSLPSPMPNFNSCFSSTLSQPPFLFPSSLSPLSPPLFSLLLPSHPPRLPFPLYSPPLSLLPSSSHPLTSSPLPHSYFTPPSPSSLPLSPLPPPLLLPSSLLLPLSSYFLPLPSSSPLPLPSPSPPPPYSNSISALNAIKQLPSVPQKGVLPTFVFIMTDHLASPHPARICSPHLHLLLPFSRLSGFLLAGSYVSPAPLSFPLACLSFSRSLVRFLCLSIAPSINRSSLQSGAVEREAFLEAVATCRLYYLKAIACPEFIPLVWQRCGRDVEGEPRARVAATQK
ncbi:hypothetical protein C7M84_002928 [Penaeus vannamei]|uniref:Uncharacterized protein n=1 Tax=Penaeus vannamei TaxID=6689 RepID=A0A3R7QGS2_PENVA|nr:hypothetical protein C7M84_002928 [Penaeus vannamei]